MFFSFIYIIIGIEIKSLGCVRGDRESSNFGQKQQIVFRRSFKT